jgi:5'-phosphate synthase pdxT subunit
VTGRPSLRIGVLALQGDVREHIASLDALGVDAFGVRRNAFGRQVDSFEEDLPFAGLADPVHAVFIRAPWVERVGERVEVLATAAGHPVAVRQEHLLATSFHPEVGGDARVHGAFVDLVAAR